MNLRQWASSLVRKRPWIPLAAVLVAAMALTATIATGMRRFWVLAGAAALTLSAYVWGYSARALKSVRFASLDHLRRRQYAEVWDAMAASPWQAMAAACGEQEECAVHRSAERPVRNLLELATPSSQDNILEIGCGVGRIGLELALHCRTWTGADMSGNMLACAAERLRELNNVRLVKLQRSALDQFASNSFDLVYSTNMFDHLDEIDRWCYVEDAFRVLRPGGRLFIDNVDFESDAGWSAFVRGARPFQDLERPPYIPTPATAAEYLTYASRAGFEQAQIHRRPPLLILTAVKPTSG